MTKNLLNLCYLWETKKTAYQGVCQKEKNIRAFRAFRVFRERKKDIRESKKQKPKRL